VHSYYCLNNLILCRIMASNCFFLFFFFFYIMKLNSFIAFFGIHYYFGQYYNYIIKNVSNKLEHKKYVRICNAYILYIVMISNTYMYHYYQSRLYLLRTINKLLCLCFRCFGMISFSITVFFKF